MVQGPCVGHPTDKGELENELEGGEAVHADRELVLKGSADAIADLLRKPGKCDRMSFSEALCEHRKQVRLPLQTCRLQEGGRLSNQTLPRVSFPDIHSRMTGPCSDRSPNQVPPRVNAVEALDDLIAHLHADLTKTEGTMTEAERMVMNSGSDQEFLRDIPAEWSPANRFEETTKKPDSDLPRTRVAAIDDLGPLLQAIRSKGSFGGESDVGQQFEETSQCSSKDQSDHAEEYAVFFHDPNAVDDSARQIQDMVLPPRPPRMRRRRRIDPKNFPKGRSAGKRSDERSHANNLVGLLDDLSSERIPQIEMAIVKPVGNQYMSKVNRKRGHRDGSPDESGSGNRVQQPEMAIVLPPAVKDVQARRRIHQAVRSVSAMAKGSAELRKDRADSYMYWEPEEDGPGCPQSEVKNSIESSNLRDEVQMGGTTALSSNSQTLTATPLCPQPPPGRALRRAPSLCGRVRRCVAG